MRAGVGRPGDAGGGGASGGGASGGGGGGAVAAGVHASSFGAVLKDSERCRSLAIADSRARGLAQQLVTRLRSSGVWRTDNEKWVDFEVQLEAARIGWDRKTDCGPNALAVDEAESQLEGGAPPEDSFRQHPVALSNCYYKGTRTYER